MTNDKPWAQFRQCEADSHTMVSGDLASVSDVYQIEANKKKFLLWQEMGRAWHFLQKWLFLKNEESKKKKKNQKTLAVDVKIAASYLWLAENWW